MTKKHWMHIHLVVLRGFQSKASSKMVWNSQKLFIAFNWNCFWFPCPSVISLTRMYSISIQFCWKAYQMSKIIHIFFFTVFVFSPASPTPIYCSNDLLKKYSIVAAKFVPSRYSNDARRKWFERTQIYFTSTNVRLTISFYHYDDINISRSCIKYQVMISNMIS